MDNKDLCFNRRILFDRHRVFGLVCGVKSFNRRRRGEVISDLMPMPHGKSGLSLIEKTNEQENGKMKKGLFVLAAVLIASSFASATIDHGTYSGATVDYSVEEDDQGLFGAPLSLGDLLYFSLTDFKVAASGAGGVDNLDGTLQILIDAKDGFDIDSVELEEFGDYYLFDNGVNGTIGTNVEVVAFAFVTILEVDGSVVAPITEHGLAVYSPVGGLYDLPTYGDLDSNEMEWEAEVKFDIDAILADAGVAGKATLVQFSLDNKLYARSEDGTQAEIAKKGAYAITLTVPEPATMALLGLGGLLLRRRK